MRTRLQAAGVHSVMAQFVDIHGAAKGKFVPVKVPAGMGQRWRRFCEAPASGAQATALR